MADDLVINVRQIGNYPLKTPVNPADLVLIQENGLGGPYKSTTALDLISTSLSGSGGQAGIGLPLPSDALGTGVIASNLVTPIGCNQGYNFYTNNLGVVSYLNSGQAGRWCFDGSTLTFGFAPPGTPGAAVAFATPMVTFSNGGDMGLASGTLVLGRDPTGAMDSVTLQYLQAQVAALNTTINNNRTNSVISFMSRTGAVTLNPTDIQFGGGALANNANLTGTPVAPTAVLHTSTTQLATTAFVLNELNDLVVNGVVASFNGRVGVVTLTAGDLTNAGGALLDSPAFIGTPTAPTAAPGTSTYQLATTQFVTSSPQFAGVPTAPTANPGSNTGQLATTAFVTNAVAESTAGVSSFNGRTGAVTFTAGDLNSVGGALLNSPVFVGIPEAPTAPGGTNNTQIATTAFVLQEVAAATVGVASFNGRTGNVTLLSSDIASAGGAPLASPQFTGAPEAPTPLTADNSTNLATTAFVHSVVATIPAGGVTSWNTRTGAVTLQGSDVSAAGGALNASPTFSGVPAAPTASPGTNTTQLATTAFVTAAVAAVPAGPTGPTGPTGPQGPTGPTGQGISIIKAASQSDALTQSSSNPNAIFYWV